MATILSSPMTYPESDGQPMAENTLQFQWIVALQGNLDALFLKESLVFVAGDLLWYPVEGNNRIAATPMLWLRWVDLKGIVVRIFNGKKNWPQFTKFLSSRDRWPNGIHFASGL